MFEWIDSRSDSAVVKSGARLKLPRRSVKMRLKPTLWRVCLTDFHAMIEKEKTATPTHYLIEHHAA